MANIVHQWPPVETVPAEVHEKAPEPGTKLNSHYAECFGCGPEQPGGLRIQTQVGDRHIVRSTFEVTREHQGAPGLAHGGLLACAFDEALGTVVGQMLRRPAVTGRLETDFKRPVPVGSTLYLIAQLDGVAGRKIYASAEGRLDAEDGPLALRARALFVAVDFEHFSTHGDADALQKLTEADAARPDRDRWEINP